MSKVLMICSLSQNVYNFRVPLIKRMIENGFEVVTAGFDDEYQECLNSIGIEYVPIGGKYKSSSFFEGASLPSKYRKLIKSVNPDIVFTFMPKPNTFGVLAAHKMGVKKIFSMVEGAGDAFGTDTLKWKIIKKIECYLYKKAFRFSKKVFFLNEDDLEEFTSLKLLPKEKAIRINGVGVDLNHFYEMPLELQSNEFLMMARMLPAKGVFDYIECAKKVKAEFPEAVFNYLGGEGSITLSDIKDSIEKGYIKYLGTAKDVRPYLKNCIAFILPSFYREGLPMSIMEAQASGRCVITTNNVGCKDSVVDGETGFIVEKHDYSTMAEKCIYLLKNKEKALSMGHRARLFAERHFDVDRINEIILSELRGLR